MDVRFYDRYKSLISNLDYTYRGYNIKYLIPGYLTCLFTDDPIVGRDVFKGFYKSTSFFDLSKILQTRKETAITFLINRKDYEDLAVSLQQYYSDSDITCIESLQQVKCSPFSWSYLKHLTKAFRIIFGRSVKESLMTKIYLVSILTNLFNQIRFLDKVKCPDNLKRYICFNTAYKEESLLTLYFKQKNIETITLQHGIFCDFKDMIPFDIINLDNLISDKILCWGQSTADYLKTKGFEESRFIMMGNPKYKCSKITHVNQSFKKCLVLLGRSVYIPSNDSLLGLLQKFNKKHNNQILFYIKKHPFVVDAEHKQFASIADNMFFVGREHSVQEILKSDMVDFTIAVNTTAYYESLAVGKLSFRWSDAENEDFVGMDDKFYDLSEFEGLIKKYQIQNEESVREEMQSVINYVFKAEN